MAVSEAISEYERTCGRNIALGRKALKLTQSQLADLVGVQQPTVARWEAGRVPADHYKAAIARALHQDVPQLFPLTRAVVA